MGNTDISKVELIDVLAENGRLQAQVDQLQREVLHLASSWDDAPEWAEFRTQDEDGSRFYWENEPLSAESEMFQDANEGGWTNGSGLWEVIPCPNWRDTLERRPEETS